MENATNALLIAGGILIAMIILSIAVFLFVSYSSIGESYEQTLSTTEIKKFNSNFLKFEERTNITIQEIVSITNFAKANEEKTNKKIKVLLRTKTEIDLTTQDSSQLIDIIKTNLVNSDSSTKYFKCDDIRRDDDTGLVNYIKFSEKI